MVVVTYKVVVSVRLTINSVKIFVGIGPTCGRHNGRLECSFYSAPLCSKLSTNFPQSPEFSALVSIGDCGCIGV